MASREALDKAYMTCAFAIAELSRARRKKVGAIIVSCNGGIIAEGCNGTPAGFDNNCEEEEVVCTHRWIWRTSTRENICTVCQKVQAGSRFYRLPEKETRLVTKAECIHAESNAIIKVARSNNSSSGATLYCTLTPCFECAKLIIQAGIVRVVYAEQYPYAGHSGSARALGIELLQKAKIPVDKLDGFTDN
jgi:dCMP deaminase